MASTAVFEWLAEGAALAGMLAALLGTLTALLQGRFAGRPKSPTLEQRIQQLTSSLQDAVTVISEMQKDIDERQKIADKLRRDAKVADRIVKLHAEEVDAVAQLVTGEQKKESRRSFWWGVAQNALFMLLGIGLGELVRYWADQG